ncbi:MAG: phosphoesterase [Francisellaceae bacterium]|nr:phosphoesterase [Francisellaceae bacterium]
MPDLHLDAINAFWDSYDRRTLYRVIVSLERAETWALDREKDVEPAVINLGKAIDSASGFDITDEALIIRLLANTHSGRAMRILQALDMARPGTASQLLMYAEDASEGKGGKPIDLYAKLFISRNLAFERLQLLSRVFSPQRITLLVKSLEKLYEKESS